MTAICATHFPSLTDAQGRRFSTTWDRLLARLSRPAVEPVKSKLQGLSLATFRGDRRKLENVEQAFAVSIDLDHLDALSIYTTRPELGTVIEAPDWDTLRKTFASSQAFVHTTWSSTLQTPRLRAFLLLSRPVDAGEYRRVYQAVASHLEAGGFYVDRQASDASRLWFVPAIAEEGRPYIFWTCTGKPIDVEAALASVPPPPPPPPPAPRPLASGGASAFDRARKYLAKCEPAIQGSGGRTTTFVTAQRLVRGFALSVEDAYALMASEFNPRCKPPWSDRDLRTKVEEAAKNGRFQDGDMLERQR